MCVHVLLIEPQSRRILSGALLFFCRSLLVDVFRQYRELFPLVNLLHYLRRAVVTVVSLYHSGSNLPAQVINNLPDAVYCVLICTRLCGVVEPCLQVIRVLLWG